MEKEISTRKRGTAMELINSATIDVDGVQRPTTNKVPETIHSTEEGIRNLEMVW